MRGFIEYMKNEKRKAANTLIAYERDLTAFEKYLAGRGTDSLEKCTDNDAISYVLQLSNENKSKPTINRKVSALRMYYEYLITKGVISENPFTRIKAIKTDKRQIDYLTIEEAAKLMDLPGDDAKGLRDKALLEFMYGTGARVTEVVRLRFSDINLRMNFVTLRDVNDESRIVPLGSYASAAMKEYIEKSYDVITGREHDIDDFIFVNFRGEPLTRQGIWKILKDYGQMLGVESRMTPQILRDSFAVHILQNGGDLRTLQELMGFEDMSVGIAYLSVIDIRVREVFRSCHPRA
ncbi:MAG: tyrosine-type recombinase/integrase [Mogibacterium sp.]|nr:tyrosine-type recombinase/integrase [Mogibacterium sp.]MBR3331408.1 tyrosine-type recombinase/integrase [Mogibacterium sp.]MBR4090483.1 tyrosine-type recombinase/integrase [Mogibacterium sp.]